MELPLMFRVRGTVIQKIWWQIILVAFYTFGLLCLHNFVDGVNINFPLTLIPVLGVVTGLLLVFRTNTAYDRYWEGRKIWSTMTLNIRTLTRCFWVMVQEKENTSRELIEKTSAINLLVAFAYATKNYLREEYSYEGHGLRELISHLPRYCTPSSTKTLEGQETRTWKRRLSTVISINSTSEDLESKNYKLTAYEKPVPTNIPIEISYYIASYINSVRERELVDSCTVSIMNSAVNNLVDCLVGFERILRTPIPLAYSVHLHQATWLYILALPYQLIGTLNWFTIPAVALAAFALFGILGIGWEIENPFGYDDNDLPLNDFCEVIHMEIIRIMSRPIPTPDTWLLSEENHPFAPDFKYTASELMKMPVDEVRNILTKVSVKTWNNESNGFQSNGNGTTPSRRCTIRH